MLKTKRELKDIIQVFHDEAYTDPVLQDLISEYYVIENLTGIKDELLLRKIFDHMDNKLQSQIRNDLQ